MGRCRNCTTCIAYCNMLNRKDNLCGLGFPVQEHLETTRNQWCITVRPVDNLCSCVPKPKSKEEFIQIAKERGIDWDPDDVITIADIF